ncbi:MAG: helix-turn-helix domain-containing protein [Chloroflexi bacterium]|nr:helix-turn-helix domain-containing protein [Chloroflexota bacterium]
MIDEILTVREVAEYLKLSRTTIWRWCNEGKLQAFKVGCGWRIHRSEVEKMVGQNLGPRKTATTKSQGIAQAAYQE